MNVSKAKPSQAVLSESLQTSERYSEIYDFECCIDTVQHLKKLCHALAFALHNILNLGPKFKKDLRRK